MFRRTLIWNASIAKFCKVDPILCEIDKIPDNWYKVLFTNVPDKLGNLVDYTEKNDFDDDGIL